MFFSHKHKHILYSCIEGYVGSPDLGYKIAVFMKSGATHEFSFQTKEEVRDAVERLRENVGQKDPR